MKNSYSCAEIWNTVCLLSFFYSFVISFVKNQVRNGQNMKSERCEPLKSKVALLWFFNGHSHVCFIDFLSQWFVWQEHNAPLKKGTKVRSFDFGACAFHSQYLGHFLLDSYKWDVIKETSPINKLCFQFLHCRVSVNTFTITTTVGLVFVISRNSLACRLLY